MADDEIYWDDTDLRRWLEAEDQSHVLAVVSSHLVWHDGAQERRAALGRPTQWRLG